MKSRLHVESLFFLQKADTDTAIPRGAATLVGTIDTPLWRVTAPNEAPNGEHAPYLRLVNIG